jgi:enoyl-CoA hydratase/carnithine racemase
VTGRITKEKLEPGIVRVLIDNQAKRNAISVAMWQQLADLFRELDADGQLRCVIVRGAGDEAFGAGADISEFEQTRSSAAQARTYAELVQEALGAIRHCRHPVIAAIRGLCVGGGLELATCTDIRIASAGSRFGIPVKRLGLTVAYDELRPLVELVGRAGALRILLEGDLFGADEALRMGLVTRVVPDAELDDAALASAQKIAEGAPLVARWHKKFVNRLMDPRPLSEEERAESYACFDTEDFRIGSRAFLAKEKPRFTGR